MKTQWDNGKSKHLFSGKWQKTSQFTLQNPRKAQNLEDLLSAEDGVQENTGSKPRPEHHTMMFLLQTPAQTQTHARTRAHTRTRGFCSRETKQERFLLWAPGEWRPGNGLLQPPFLLPLPGASCPIYAAPSTPALLLHPCQKLDFIFLHSHRKKSLDNHLGLLDGKHSHSLRSRTWRWPCGPPALLCVHLLPAVL